MLAWRDPAATGLKLTLMVQFVAGASELPQLLVCEKSPGSSPVIVRLVIVSVALPALLKVSFCGLVAVPTFTFPKESVLGDNVTVAAMPVPVKEAVCGLPVALSATLTVAVRSPAAVGLKVTLIWQVPPATTLVHVLLWKSSLYSHP